MTTEEMKYWVAWHFHYRLKYPLVACECIIGYHNFGDVVAVKNITIEVEIKQNTREIFDDLKKKRHKHEVYLVWSDKRMNGVYPHTRPNKFYFAIPDTEIPNRNYLYQHFKISNDFPKAYGLITINKCGYCETRKRAKYLSRDISQVENIKETINKRLTAENLGLRERLLRG